MNPQSRKKCNLKIFKNIKIFTERLDLHHKIGHYIRLFLIFEYNFLYVIPLYYSRM